MNMSVEELSEWLDTDDSNAVGQKESDGEAKGHKSGRSVPERHIYGLSTHRDIF